MDRLHGFNWMLQHAFYFRRFPFNVFSESYGRFVSKSQPRIYGAWAASSAPERRWISEFFLFSARLAISRQSSSFSFTNFHRKNEWGCAVSEWYARVLQALLDATEVFPFRHHVRFFWTVFAQVPIFCDRISSYDVRLVMSWRLKLTWMSCCAAMKWRANSETWNWPPRCETDDNWFWCNAAELISKLIQMPLSKDEKWKNGQLVPFPNPLLVSKITNTTPFTKIRLSFN